jgi:hypothetical protein
LISNLLRWASSMVTARVPVLLGGSRSPRHHAMAR